MSIATTRSQTNAGRLREAGADVRGRPIPAKSQPMSPARTGRRGCGAGSRRRATAADTVKTLRPFGAVSVIGLVGAACPEVVPPDAKHLPAAVRLNFFPSGLLGTAALAAVGFTAAMDCAGSRRKVSTSHRRMPGRFDFDEVRQAHSLMESEPALGKLVVRL
ncbi:hypothetical protein ACU4GD_19475 [Cupriavidus basilensis]